MKKLHLTCLLSLSAAFVVAGQSLSDLPARGAAESSTTASASTGAASGADRPRTEGAEPSTTALASPGERRSALEQVGTAEDLILLERSTRALAPVEASPDEGDIARLTAEILSRSHYSRKPFDDEVSSSFLDTYIRNLDSLRLHFLKPDIEEFDKYRFVMDDLTRKGDTRVAREVFERFLHRLEQRVVFVGELLKTETFTFDGNDRHVLDREKAEWSADLDAAKALWRQHLRYEILQERLNLSAAAGVAGGRPHPRPTPAPAEKAAPAASTVLGSNGLSDDIVKTITRRYARILKTLRDFDGGDVFQYYLSSLTHVYDPHSDYMGQATVENFAISMNLSLFGIGAVLQSEDGYCKVKELRPGPAMKSKRLKPGDRITAVAQGEGEPVDVVDMKLNRIVELVRGPRGTTVRLTVIPADATDPSERRVVSLVREEIKLEDEEAKARILDIPAGDGRTNRIGVIDLPTFYASMSLGNRNGRSRTKSTTVDVARLLSKLKEQQVEGVILDLRHNGGGALEEAIDLTGLFIRQGPVVQVKDTLGRVIIDEDNNSTVMYDGPLVVLTSRFSASASEIVAGALQDYGRALIVGDSSTHGKGTVQSLIELKPMLEPVLADASHDPGALKLTIRKFYRASGASTQLKGVVPDVVLPSVNNLAKVGESALDNPLSWDEIDRAPFKAEDRIAPILSELQRRSAKRIAGDRDFQYVLEDVELYRKHRDDRSVSLNEAERRREVQEAEARLAARKEERKRREEPADVIYDINLAQVALPGLPPPTVPTNSVAVVGSDPAPVPSGFDDEAAEEKEAASAVDPTLKEARRLLLDLAEFSKARTELARRQIDR